MNKNYGNLSHIESTEAMSQDFISFQYINSSPHRLPFTEAIELCFMTYKHNRCR
jgi:hypothetical protein